MTTIDPWPITDRLWVDLRSYPHIRWLESLAWTYGHRPRTMDLPFICMFSSGSGYVNFLWRFPQTYLWSVVQPMGWPMAPIGSKFLIYLPFCDTRFYIITTHKIYELCFKDFTWHAMTRTNNKIKRLKT